MVVVTIGEVVLVTVNGTVEVSINVGAGKVVVLVEVKVETGATNVVVDVLQYVEKLMNSTIVISFAMVITRYAC